MNVRFTDNHEAFIRAMGDALPQALEAIGQAAESYAKLKLSEPKAHADGSMRPNVVTGRLRNSISHAVDGDAAVVGTNVEYAPYVELGTSKSRPYPYLKPAAQDHVDEYKQIALNTLRSS